MEARAADELHSHRSISCFNTKQHSNVFFGGRGERKKVYTRAVNLTKQSVWLDHVFTCTLFMMSEQRYTDACECYKMVLKIEKANEIRANKHKHAEQDGEWECANK